MLPPDHKLHQTCWPSFDIQTHHLSYSTLEEQFPILTPSLLTFFSALSASCYSPSPGALFCKSHTVPMEVVCVCVCLQSTVSTVKMCVQEISDFIMPPFFPFSFPCCPISTSPQCFPSCLLTHSLLPSCLSDICLVITSHMLQIWTQIIRVEWLGWGQQWHSPSNLSSDWWCFALPLRHLKNRSSAPLLSPLSVFCFTASLPCLLLCLVSPVFPDFQTFQTPPPHHHQHLQLHPYLTQ